MRSLRGVTLPVLLTAAVAAALVWLALPLLPLVLWAGADAWTGPVALPQTWGLRGWREAWAAGAPAAVSRSLALGLVVAALATPLGLAAGRVLGWRLTRRPRLLVVVLLLPVLLPPFAVAMGLDVVLVRLRVPEPVAVVLVLVALAVPYCASACAAGFARCPPALEEQARALGASPAQARRRVTLPAVGPSVAVAALLAFLVGWSDYVVTLLLGGGRLVTAPVLLGASAAGSGNEPATAALAVLTVLPPVLVAGALTWLLAARRRTAVPR